MSSFNQHLEWREGERIIVQSKKIKDKEVLKATNEKRKDMLSSKGCQLDW